MTRRTYRFDKREGRMVEITPPDRRVGITFIEDSWSKNPTRSIVDGRPLTSRADLRRHNAELDVHDVGNDEGIKRSAMRGKEYEPIPGIDESLQRAWSKANG